MTTGYETGEFQEDGALDARDSLIDWIVQRIESTTGLEGFCGVDVFGVRADIAMLATVIGTHGGRHLIEREKVKEWAQIIDQPFTTEDMWGFTGWPDEAWSEWRMGCQQTVQKLLDVLED